MIGASPYEALAPLSIASTGKRIEPGGKAPPDQHRTGIVVALSVSLVLAIVLLVMYGLDPHRITFHLHHHHFDAMMASSTSSPNARAWDRARAAIFAWTSTAWSTWRSRPRLKCARGMAEGEGGHQSPA
jgi:hypothetical protein